MTLNSGNSTAVQVGVTDSTGWGYSLANLAEILFPCLDAIRARSVVELGAYRGELTRELLDWADRAGANIAAIDPEPPSDLVELAEQHPELTLIRKTSHDALREVPLPDAFIIDSDHNYYTLSEELRLISERAPGAVLPLLMFHDVSWPHARRDTYYVPERIPEGHRQPLAHDVYLAPWEGGVAQGGLPFAWAAEREGGPRNGTLTALEDFVAAHEGARLATVPAFFGLGILWHEAAPWSDAISEIVEPWDRNPLVERLEANRVAHLATRHHLATDLERAWETNSKQDELLRDQRQRLTDQGERLAALEERLNRQSAVLRTMLESRAFALAERLSRVWQRGAPAMSRDRIRRVLAEDQTGR